MNYERIRKVQQVGLAGGDAQAWIRTERRLTADEIRQVGDKRVALAKIRDDISRVAGYGVSSINNDISYLDDLLEGLRRYESALCEAMTGSVLPPSAT